jgi:hypothetical protein
VKNHKHTATSSNKWEISEEDATGLPEIPEPDAEADAVRQPEDCPIHMAMTKFGWLRDVDCPMFCTSEELV